MEMQRKYALTPIAGAVAAALCPAQQATAQSDEFILDEIIVTATKRTSNVQDIPASIQAITQDTLAAMGAKNMEDYARFIPAVNVVSYASGSTTVIFRGAITGAGYIAQSTSSVYLDEISVTTTGAQPAIRMVDMARVEALAGPQGTLYGSDAQAGTLRIITNKPVLNTFEAVFDGEIRGGDMSDMSHRGSLVFNIPLVDDKLAVRLVGYNDHDGGFIDNVFGHTPDTSANGLAFPAEWGSLDNAGVVEDRWNDATIDGVRGSLLWALNDEWSLNLTALTQRTRGGADSDYDPFVGDLQVVRFHDEFRKDDYEMYSLVVEGDLGFAQLVASVNYYERDVRQMDDITVYGHYWAGLYCLDSAYTTSDIITDPLSPYYGEYYFPYYWENPATGYIIWWPAYCMGPTVDSDYFQNYYAPFTADKFTTEIRLSTQGETLDWIVGFYYEESNDSWTAPFADSTTGGDGTGNLYQNSISLQFMEWYFSNYYGTPVTYPDATSWWVSDSDTDWDQTAIFGELTWHINDRTDLTVGGRYYERNNNNLYRVDHPGDASFTTGEPDTADPGSRAFRIANNNIAADHRSSESDFHPKIALSYSLDDDKMVYGLYTQGTRPGGVNRSRGEPFFATSYTADLMDNYEMGYRSTFAGGRGRFNATAYHMVWTNYQLELVDPSNAQCPVGTAQIPGVCGQPWQNIVTNAGEAHITGFSVELDYAVNDSWVIGFNATSLEAETDTTADLNGDGSDDLIAGLRLPLTPDFKASAWADFTTPTQWLGGNEMFARLQVSHTGDSMNTLEPAGLDTGNPQFVNEAYSIADIRAGIRGDDWEISVFLNNITDERATYTIGTGQMQWSASSVADGRAHWQRAFTNRPREFGLRVMRRWGG